MNRKQKEYMEISELSVNCFTFKHNETLTKFERGKDSEVQDYEVQYIQKGLWFCL